MKTKFFTFYTTYVTIYNHSLPTYNLPDMISLRANLMPTALSFLKPNAIIN